MFERFTDEGRTVLVRAQEVGKEIKSPFLRRHHMLIALIDGADANLDGLVAGVFDDSGVVRTDLRSKLLSSVLSSEHPTDESGSIPFSSGGKKALELALREALSLGHNYIDGAHMLLAILRSADGPLEEVVDASSLKYGKARDFVRDRAPQRAPKGSRGLGRRRGSRRQNRSRAVESVLERAFERAGRDRDVTTGDLLVALVETPDTHFHAIVASTPLTDTDAVLAAAAALVGSGANDGAIDSVAFTVDDQTGAITINDPELNETLKGLLTGEGSTAMRDAIHDALREALRRRRNLE